MITLILSASLASLNPHATLYAAAHSCRSVIEPVKYQRAIKIAEKGLIDQLGLSGKNKAIIQIKSKSKPMNNVRFCNNIIDQVLKNVHTR